MRDEDISISELLQQYGIDYDLLSEEQKEALQTRGDVWKIQKALDVLTKLNIPVKSIEKCPSILYLNPDSLVSNYEFLIDKGIDRDKIIGCLHVLSSDSVELRNTYDYVSSHYGVETFNKNVSILSVPISRIQEIEDNFSNRLNPSAMLSVAITTLRIPEINEILTACEGNGIEVTGSFFQKGVKEITEIIRIFREKGEKVVGSAFKKSSIEVGRIIDVCQEKGVEVTGSVFLKDSLEVGKIIDTCRKRGIPITGSVFRRDAAEIEEIVEVCLECGIKVSGTVLLRTGEEIRRIVKVCKDNGIEITANVFKKSAAQIEEIVEVCKKHKVKASAPLFSKSAESLDKSMSYIEANYVRSYLISGVVTCDLSHLQKVFPYLEKEGLLPAVIPSSAILTLTFEEIEERRKFIKEHGEDDIVNGRFNRIYGLSRKKYNEMLKENTKSNGGSTKK